MFVRSRGVWFGFAEKMFTYPENMFLAKTTVILSLNLYSFTNIGWSLRLLEKAWQRLFLWVINLKFRNYKDLYEKPCKCDWMAKVVFLKQILPTFGGRCNRCFWDIRLKILRLPNFNMLFSFCWQNFSKVNCFLVYRKSITWSSHAEPIALYPVHTFKCVLFCEVEMYQFCNSQTVHFVKASKYIWGQNWSDVVKAKIPGESKLTSV